MTDPSNLLWPPESVPEAVALLYDGHYWHLAGWKVSFERQRDETHPDCRRNFIRLVQRCLANGPLQTRMDDEVVERAKAILKVWLNFVTML